MKYASISLFNCTIPFPPLPLRCGEGVDRTLLSSLLHMFVDLQVNKFRVYIHWRWNFTCDLYITVVFVSIIMSIIDLCVIIPFSYIGMFSNWSS